MYATCMSLSIANPDNEKETEVTDLYDQLGVAKDATRDAIKRAFRRKAKDTHPDAGGDAKAFHAIELAHRVLTDDAARARYDRTGQAEAEPDNSEAEAHSIISAFVERFVADDKAKYKNLVQELRAAVKSEIAQAERNIQEGRKFEERTVDLRSRVRGKAGAALLTKMFDTKLRDAAVAIQMLQHQVDVRKRALMLVEDVEFDADSVPDTDQTYTIRARDMRRMMEEAATNSFWR